MAGGGVLRSRWIMVGAVAALAGLVPAAPAPAQDRPWVSAPPAITGSAIVGATLTSVGGQAGGPPRTTVGRAWLRCTSPTDERSCRLINGAWNTSTYRVTSADLGRRIRSALYAYRDPRRRDFVWRLSPATAVVANPAPAPTPTPTPTPTPAPPPVTQPLPTEQASPVAVVPVGTRAKRMRPFPFVRISGVLITNGARISRLTVRAPRRARITVKCSGRGCPRHRVARTLKKRRTVHIPQFETSLRAGVKLTITVSKRGYLSKVTTIRIRRAKPPLRSDLCRAPGAKKLSRCPGR